MKENYCYNCMKETNSTGNKCSVCGCDRNIPVRKFYLKPSTILNGKYMVGNPIGKGGFGITYVGYDNTLDVKVAIKEFFPQGFVTRNIDEGNEITVNCDSDVQFVEKEKDHFLIEARSCARFRNEKGIVNVWDYFEENNTAYIVMEFLEGINLLRYVNENGPIDPEIMFRLMMPVMKSLSKVNDENIIHRDITPENIMYLNDGTLKVMDFGSARKLDEEYQTEFTILLKQGYAPEEQYRSNSGEQGPWTDVYGLCASIYRCITGVTPPGAVDRLKDDKIQKPSEFGIRISSKLEEVLMYGLAVKREDRCMNMYSLYELSDLALSGVSLTKVKHKISIEKSKSETEDTFLIRDLSENYSSTDDNKADASSSNQTGKDKNMFLSEKKNIILLIAGIAVIILLCVLVLFLIFNVDAPYPSAKTHEEAPTQNTTFLVHNKNYIGYTVQPESDEETHQTEESKKIALKRSDSKDNDSSSKSGSNNGSGGGSNSNSNSGSSSGSGTGISSGSDSGSGGDQDAEQGGDEDAGGDVPQGGGDEDAGSRNEVGREDFPDCDGSGHGYYAVYYSDGSVEYVEY